MDRFLNIFTLISLSFLLSCGVAWQEDTSEDLGIFKLEKRRRFSFYATLNNTSEKETYLYLKITLSKTFNEIPNRGVYELYIFNNEYFAKIKVSGKALLENEKLILTPTSISPESCDSSLVQEFIIDYSYGSTSLEINFNGNLISLAKPNGANLTPAESWESICIDYVIE